MAARAFSREELGLARHSGPISPSALPPYTKGELKQSYDAFSLQERIMMNGVDLAVVQASYQHVGGAAGAQGELRVCLYHLATSMATQPAQVYVYEEKNERIGIMMRPLRIVEGDGGVPLIFVEYIMNTRDDPELAKKVKTFLGDSQQRLDSDRGRSWDMIEMMSLLLNLNAKALDDDDEWVKQQHKRLRRDHFLSFLCPVGIPTVKGKVATCVCGKEGKSVCARCKMVFYCSKECQKSDWKAHKPSCQEPVAGTDFVDVDVTKVPPALEGMFHSNISLNTSASQTPKKVDKDVQQLSSGKPIPNKKREEVCVVKVQVPANGSYGNMMCYDQKRSFTVYIGEHNAPKQDCKKLYNHVRAKGMLGGLKAYLNAILMNEGKTLRVFTNGVVEGAMW